MAAPRDHAGNPLGLLAVHAHPDDEASKGAGTVAKYTAEGIRCVLACLLMALVWASGAKPAIDPRVGYW